MLLPPATAEETIWRGCAAYGADARVEVGDRWFRTGFPYPGLNGIFPDGRPVDIAAALAPFRDRGVPMLWHLGPTGPPGLAAELERSGARFEEVEPLMVAELPAAAPAPVPAGLEIVDGPLADFVEVWNGKTDPDDLAWLVRLRGASPHFLHRVGLLDGVPVGCAAAFHDPAGPIGEVQHVVTAATARRRGVGAALTGAILAALGGRGCSHAVLTASPYGERIYQRLGFHTVGEVPEVRVLTLRTAAPRDAYDIVRINVHGWREAYAGIVPDDVLAAMDIETRAERYRRQMLTASPFESLVATEADAVIGYVHFGPYREEDQLDEAAGEVVAIYVQPDCWGTGAGRALMGAALARLAERGWSEVRLWVLEANHAARRFYARAGFFADGARAVFPVRRPDGTVVELDEVRYTRRAG